MITVKLYNFDKKSNSTKTPGSSAGTSFSCVLKESTSVINPVLIFDVGPTSFPSYNYCYIDEFDRYYFINDWTFNGPTWEANMTVDVLASYKSTIGSKELYILRSASNYDLFVVDDTYQTKYALTHDSSNAPAYITLHDIEDSTVTRHVQNPFHIEREDGYYYLKVLTCGGSTGIVQIVMNQTGFNQLTTALGNINYSDIDDVSLGIARALANPFQYIISCYWLPYLAPGITLGSLSINVGYYNITITSGAKLIARTGFKATMSMNIKDHPQSSRGWYVNQAPYANITLKFQPFGNFNLAASDLAGSTTIDISWYIDIWTGQALLNVTSGASGALLVNTSSDYGVPVEIAQITSNVKTIGISALANVPTAGIGDNFVGSTSGIDVLGIAKGIANTKIGSGYMNSGNTVNMKGASGSFIAFMLSPTIEFTFYTLLDEDLEHSGRPLCKEKVINTLSGFIQCRDGDIEIACTDYERGQISDYLIGGFFYE